MWPKHVVLNYSKILDEEFLSYIYIYICVYIYIYIYVCVCVCVCVNCRIFLQLSWLFLIFILVHPIWFVQLLNLECLKLLIYVASRKLFKGKVA